MPTEMPPKSKLQKRAGKTTADYVQDAISDIGKAGHSAAHRACEVGAADLRYSRGAADRPSGHDGRRGGGQGTPAEVVGDQRPLSFDLGLDRVAEHVPPVE